ncbi:hypothetical protein [Cohnella luojiensis]|uniref:Uncharacterized protein n=1 Tax=Cohnella luojiensis TaxID=652876 RepID=A0A4Y8LU46_9BACL|nr:hypothetical protein [Cohnella luojiensis]TFE23220.1 hypothetical protein E2980_20000 [Cohnella luojiensis]
MNSDSIKFRRGYLDSIHFRDELSGYLLHKGHSIVDEKWIRSNLKDLHIEFNINSLVLATIISIRTYDNYNLSIQSDAFMAAIRENITDLEFDLYIQKVGECILYIIGILEKSGAFINKSFYGNYVRKDYTTYVKLGSADDVIALKDDIKTIIKASECQDNSEHEFEIALYGTAGKNLAVLLDSMKIATYSSEGCCYVLNFIDSNHDSNQDFLDNFSRYLIKLGFILNMNIKESGM